MPVGRSRSGVAGAPVSGTAMSRVPDSVSFSTIAVVSLGRHAKTSGRMRKSGSLGVADGVGVGDGLGDGEVCELGKRLALAEALAVGVALPDRRGPSLGKRGPPDRARATTVPVSAASAIMTAYKRHPDCIA